MSHPKPLMQGPKPSGKTAVGLFCGCGGLDLGAKLAGFELVGAFDTDPIAIDTYKANVSPHAYVADLTLELPIELPRDIDLLLGSPPCQGFSSAGTNNRGDPRNLLWAAYLNVISKARPKAFVLENVWGFQHEYAKFADAVSKETGEAYAIDFRKINMQFYGVPQARLRFIVVGTRRDVCVTPPWPEPVTQEVWGYRRSFPGMISLSAAVEDLGPSIPTNDPNAEAMGIDHVHLPLEDNHYAIACNIPNGGSLKDIPDSHLPPPYFGRRRDSTRGWQWFYRKPLPQLPGRTVVASPRPVVAQILAPDVYVKSASGRHFWDPVNAEEFTNEGLYTSPVPPRRLTVRECARIQTFPDWFRFHGDIRDRYRQIGNAVPCEYARRLCCAISDAIDGIVSDSVHPMTLDCP